MPDPAAPNPNAVFVSAVSSEFAALRTELAASLRRANKDVHHHDELRHGSSRLLTDLENEISSCTLLVLIVGQRSGGGFPTDTEVTGFTDLLPPPQTRAPYTQWEFLLASKHKLRLLVYVPDPGFTQTPPPDPPHEDDDPAVQARFVAWLTDTGITRTPFATVDALCRAVHEQLDKPVEAFHQLAASIGALFMGRTAFLATLHRTLTDNATATITAVHGLGGVGKTRVAIEYAHEYAAAYPGGRALVAAGSADALTSSLAAALGLAGLLEQPEDARRAQLQAWLNHRGEWLLILDGADSAESVAAIERLRSGLTGGRLLMTSWRTDLPLAFKALPLDMLALPDATALLLAGTADARSRRDDDQAQAEALAETMGGLALALTHAVAYVRQRKISLTEYRARLDTRLGTLTGFVAPQVTGYDRSIEATLALSVADLTPGGRALLERLSFLANSPVPMSLLSPAVLGEQADAVEAALADLDTYSLIARNPEDGTFTVPHLVREVTRAGLPEERRPETPTAALAWVNAAFHGDPSDPRLWPRLVLLAAHGEVVAEHGAAAGIDEPTGRLMNQLGLLYLGRAQFGPAERMMRDALAAAEHAYRPDHPDVATRLNNFAGLLQATNRLAEAEPLYRRALVITEASLGPDHPNVATDLNNLALLLRATNRLAEAEPLYRRALAIVEASLGPDHPNVATSLNNLAELLRATNRLAEAEPLYRRAVLILLRFKRATGHEHPHLEICLNNYAGALGELGRSEAEIMAAIQALRQEAGLA